MATLASRWSLRGELSTLPYFLCNSTFVRSNRPCKTSQSSHNREKRARNGPGTLRKGWVMILVSHVKQRTTSRNPAMLRVLRCEVESMFNDWAVQQHLPKIGTLTCALYLIHDERGQLTFPVITYGYDISTPVPGQTQHQSTRKLVSRKSVSPKHKPTYTCSESIARAHLLLALHRAGHDRPARGWRGFRSLRSKFLDFLRSNAVGNITHSKDEGICLADSCSLANMPSIMIWKLNRVFSSLPLGIDAVFQCIVRPIKA
jgi:hypothetical protein